MITKSIIEGVDHQWFSLTKSRSAHVSASNREKVAVLLGVPRQRAKRGEPGQGEPTKDCLYALPPRFLDPSCLFFFQRLDACFVIPDGRNLCPKHDGREQGEQESFKQKEEYEYHCRRRAVGCTVFPVAVDAGDEVMNTKEQTVIGNKANVESKQDEKLLILLSYAVVHPGTMMIHLFDAPLTDRTMVSSFWLNTAAFWTFEDHLSLLKPHSLDIFLRSIPLWNSSWVCEHGAEVGADGEKGEALKY